MQLGSSSMSTSCRWFIPCFVKRLACRPTIEIGRLPSLDRVHGAHVISSAIFVHSRVQWLQTHPHEDECVNGPGIICPVSIVAAILVMFLAFRLVPWMRRKGWFTNKSSGSGGGFIVLQEIVEPQVQHVIQVKDQKRRGADAGPPPDDDIASTHAHGP